MRFIALMVLLMLSAHAQAQSFVKVKGTRFVRDGVPYHFLGTNFWYGMNLGSEGAGGDRARLVRELDRLQALGVKNLRVLAASEGPDGEPYRIAPASQASPGVLSEPLLKGLDFLLVEMQKRDMLAVVCLNNFWPWSGGMAQYLQWAGAGSIPYPPPHPGGDWDTYQQFTSKFYLNAAAMEASDRVVRAIVTRTNSYNGVKYTNDPTIMAWQLANEPRGMKNAEAMNRWIERSSDMIRSLDANHLITVGSEGETPWPSYTGTDLVTNHRYKNIDYATIHVWAQNWDWFDPANVSGTYASAVGKMKTYVRHHVEEAKKLGKPLVMEEFGIGRDGGSYDPAAPTTLRDQYYREVFEEVYRSASAGTPLAGVNFWAWAGEGMPQQPYGSLWKKTDPFTGDPPHEFQGWYSVYATDASTQGIIHEYSRKLDALR